MGQEDSEIQSKSRAQESTGTIKEDRRKHVLRLCCDAVRAGLGPSEFYREFYGLRVCVGFLLVQLSKHEHLAPLKLPGVNIPPRNIFPAI